MMQKQRHYNKRRKLKKKIERKRVKQAVKLLKQMKLKCSRLNGGVIFEFLDADYHIKYRPCKGYTLYDVYYKHIAYTTLVSKTFHSIMTAKKLDRIFDYLGRR